MFTYTQIIDLCHTLGLNPNLQGSNVLASGRPLGVFKEPINLKDIGFPDEERIHVEEIGLIIFNLLSQKKLAPIYRFGSEEMLRDKNIERIMPILISSQLFYFEHGCVRAELVEHCLYVLHKGKVYKKDPLFTERMNKFDEEMEKIRRESILMQAKSWEDAKNFIFTA